MKKPLKSKVAIFLQELIEAEGKPDHQMLELVLKQIGTLMILVDTNPKFQETARRLLNKIKETWDDESTPRLGTPKEL